MTKPETEWVIVPRDLLSRIDDLLNSVDLTGTGYSPSKRIIAQAEADCDAVRALLAASPPAPSVGDVVELTARLRECVNKVRGYDYSGYTACNLLTNTAEEAAIELDRMAAALVEAQREIERLKAR